MLILLAIVAICASCKYNGHKIKGNGRVITQSKPIGDIRGVDLHSSFDVVLIEGNPSNIRMEGEENILPHIRLHVVNGILNIESDDNVWLRPKKKVKIFVTSPSFNRIENTGSGDITSETKISSDTKLHIDLTGSGNLKLDVDAPEVDATVTGSGGIKLSGETQKFRGEVTGSGDIRAMDLLAEESNVQVTGSGNIDTYSSVKIVASISGSGDIRYKGGAQVVTSSDSGSGDLRKVD